MSAQLLLGAWAEHGTCVTNPPPGVDWFPNKDADMEARAIAACETCPVRADCLDHAIAIGERHGIWGGHTPRQRERLARDRRGKSRVIRHGTAAGYAAHRRAGEEACAPCKAAHSSDVQGRKAATAS